MFSDNGEKVKRWFGVKDLERNGQRRLRVKIPELALAGGTITLITGASGSGKSTLLRKLRRRYRDAHWIDVSRIPLPDVLVVDCFQSDDLESILAILGRVGLGEVWTYLRRPMQLSVGQRCRLRWAIALWQACLLQPATRCYIQTNFSPLRPRDARAFPPLPPGEGRGEGDYPTRPPLSRVILSNDEFCAVLDTVTARILARCLRRSIEGGGSVSVVLATARSDLEPALRPDMTVRCDFGECAVA